jgi:5-methyltetrahydropteroyltriglutamate--homocysteine methyltransferase
MPDEQYSRLMDEMVVFAIRLQEQAGIDVVSDGEWRRTHYIGELLTRLGGFRRARPFMHQGELKHTDVSVGRMDYTKPIFARDAEFLVEATDRRTKFALPSPFLIAIRYWHEDYSTDAYPTMNHFLDHLTEIIAAEARAVTAAGIDIVQIDDPALTYFCDRELTESGDSHDDRLKRDWDADRQMPDAINAINRIAEGLQAEVHLHCCHSVYRRQSDVRGDYKPILPRLVDARIDRVNLEFAYQDTGAIDDLDLLPDHIDVGMGVLDIRGERLQSIEEIETLAAAGADRIGPSRIALNPDCGFAPDAAEPPSIDEAFEKLSRLVNAAERLRARF